MSVLHTAFAKLLTDQAELQRKFQEQAQALFKDITKEFFEKNPGITGVVWTQYTPYFNDGDACVFHVNDATFTNAPFNELNEIRWGEYEGETEGVWAAENVAYILENGGTSGTYHKELRDLILASGGVDVESCKLFNQTICSSEMESVMLAMFGDHSKVIATRDGFDVDEYTHE